MTRFFSLGTMFHCMDTLHVCLHISRLQFLTLLGGNADVNIHAQVLVRLYVFISPRYMLTSGIAGLAL